MAGANPQTASDVNVMVGSLLRQFIAFQQQTARYQAWMAANDLKVITNWPAAAAGVSDEANIKSAISGLNTALAAIDLTFINRLTGLF